jgi:hypothetical protein
MMSPVVVSIGCVTAGHCTRPQPSIVVGGIYDLATGKVNLL